MDKLDIWTPDIGCQLAVDIIFVIELVQELVMEVEIKPSQLHLEKQVKQRLLLVYVQNVNDYGKGSFHLPRKSEDFCTSLSINEVQTYNNEPLPFRVTLTSFVLKVISPSSSVILCVGALSLS